MDSAFESMFLPMNVVRLSVVCWGRCLITVGLVKHFHICFVACSLWKSWQWRRALCCSSVDLLWLGLGVSWILQGSDFYQPLIDRQTQAEPGKLNVSATKCFVPRYLARSKGWKSHVDCQQLFNSTRRVWIGRLNCAFDTPGCPVQHSEPLSTAREIQREGMGLSDWRRSANAFCTRDSNLAVASLRRVLVTKAKIVFG